ncbi:MAG: hypothetical protein ACO2ZM_04115 [Francisellaceae bacterium]
MANLPNGNHHNSGKEQEIKEKEAKIENTAADFDYRRFLEAYKRDT